MPSMSWQYLEMGNLVSGTRLRSERAEDYTGCLFVYSTMWLNWLRQLIGYRFLKLYLGYPECIIKILVTKRHSHSTSNHGTINQGNSNQDLSSNGYITRAVQSIKRVQSSRQTFIPLQRRILRLVLPSRMSFEVLRRILTCGRMQKPSSYSKCSFWMNQCLLSTSVSFLMLLEVRVISFYLSSPDKISRVILWLFGIGFWLFCDGKRESVRSSSYSWLWLRVSSFQHLITWYLMPSAKKISPTPALILQGYCTKVKLVCERHTTKKPNLQTSVCFKGFLSSMMSICFLEIYLLLRTRSQSAAEPTKMAGGSFTSLSTPQERISFCPVTPTICSTLRSLLQRCTTILLSLWKLTFFPFY